MLLCDSSSFHFTFYVLGKRGLSFYFSFLISFVNQIQVFPFIFLFESIIQRWIQFEVEHAICALFLLSIIQSNLLFTYIQENVRKMLV